MCDTDIPNGEGAIEAHEKRPADVLITDLFRARWVRDPEVLPRTQYPGMRFLVISGWKRAQQTDYLAVALHAGADAIVRKPFTPGELLYRRQPASSSLARHSLKAGSARRIPAPASAQVWREEYPDDN